jgi:hypothetical protein
MTVVRWIEHPSEPKELLLAWQAPPSVPDRSRWAVGRLWPDGEDTVFDYLQAEEFKALNLGRSPDELRAAGYSGYPAFDVRKRPAGGYREHVLEAFLRRLPPATRSDFPAYLAHYYIERHTPLSAFALLAVTEARLPSDGFSLIDPLDASVGWVDLVFEVVGFWRFIPGDVCIEPGDPLTLEPDSSNPVDPQAVQVKTSGHTIGYVNRLQAGTIRTWLAQRSVSCWIARLNGLPASPRAYAFLQVRPAERSIAA